MLGGGRSMPSPSLLIVFDVTRLGKRPVANMCLSCQARKRTFSSRSFQWILSTGVDWVSMAEAGG